MTSELVKEIYSLRGMVPSPEADARIARIAIQVSAMEQTLGEKGVKDSLINQLIDRLHALEQRVEALEDPEVDEALQEAVTEGLYDQLATVSCGCPRSDDDVHEFDCVNHPEHHQHVPVEDEWRSNPYSLPPATREGVKCPACSGPTGQTFNGARMLREVRHEDQATVDECVKRQKAMGWKPPADGPEEGYSWA